MRLVGAREASIVTDLSAHRLREWTGRRGLVSPEVPARGKGTQARFSLQTLLVLRLAAALRDRLHVELEAYRASLEMLQTHLAEESFQRLAGKSVVISIGRAALVDATSDVCLGDDDAVCVLNLQPHLDAIANAVGIATPNAQSSYLLTAALR